MEVPRREEARIRAWEGSRERNHDIRRAAQYPMHPESCGLPESEVDYVGVNIEQANKCSDAHAAYHSKGSVSIGSDVWIGLDATILSGVRIGHGAVIGKD